ncbi:hypothetical protein F4806DRAFT_65994 [Annulohypoxylon nitens]|nr:hypothetical protein F4806DRAFT_65994 [Annulohypoxylon nitens]
MMIFRSPVSHFPLWCRVRLTISWACYGNDKIIYTTKCFISWNFASGICKLTRPAVRVINPVGRTASKSSDFLVSVVPTWFPCTPDASFRSYTASLLVLARPNKSSYCRGVANQDSHNMTDRDKGRSIQGYSLTYPTFLIP